MSAGAGGNLGSVQAAPAPPAPKPPVLSLKSPEIKAGQGTAALTASLKDGAGKPVSGASVTFYVDTGFFLGTGDIPIETTRGPLTAEYGAQDGKVNGLMEIGAARTNAEGIATLKYTPALGGDLKVVAKYGSDGQVLAENTVVWPSVEQSANYEPEIGILAPFLRPKIILGVILGTIWWLFLFVLYQVYAISREKTA